MDISGYSRVKLLIIVIVINHDNHWPCPQNHVRDWPDHTLPITPTNRGMNGRVAEGKRDGKCLASSVN